mgnify:CR=1 FL=1
MNHARTVDVGGEIPYTITIGPGLLGDGAALAEVIGRHMDATLIRVSEVL